MNHLILLRHGQSRWNLENRFTGWEDVDLSAAGEAEAAEAGRAMAKLRLDRVYTSTLKRARRTAELALTAMAASGADLSRVRAADGAFRMTAHDDLRERHYGDLVGLDKAETAAKHGEEQVRLWRRSFSTRPPGGESLADVVARVRPYFEREILPHVKAGETVLVAAHGNSLRALLVALGEYGEQEIPGIEIPTGKPLVFDWEGGEKRRHYYLGEQKAA